MMRDISMGLVLFSVVFFVGACEKKTTTTTTAVSCTTTATQAAPAALTDQATSGGTVTTTTTTTTTTTSDPSCPATQQTPVTTQQPKKQTTTTQQTASTTDTTEEETTVTTKKTTTTDDEVTCDLGYESIAGAACTQIAIADATTDDVCHAIDGYWYNNVCNSTAITCGVSYTVDAAGETCVAIDPSTLTNASDCRAHDYFWYDVTDVSKSDAAGFAALVPICHSAKDTSCPVGGSLPYAKKNDSSLLSAAVTVDSIYMSYSSIVDVLSTLRCFQSLLYLELSGNSITSIDVTPNTSLVELTLSGNSLTSIDVTKNTALTSLTLTGNSFSGPVDLSHNTQLQVLGLRSVGSFNVATFDFSPFTHLINLGISGDLSTFNFANLPTTLVTLDISYASVVSANLTHLTNLTSLYAQGNGGLTTLNIAGLTHLDRVFAYNGSLTTLNLNSATSLTDLEIDGNDITSIDLSHNTALRTLWLNGNPLTSISNLNLNVELRTLMIEDIGLTGPLDLSSLTHLITAQFSGSDWSSVDLSGASTLNVVYFDNMANFALDFNKLHATFKSRAYDGYSTGVYIEQAKWDAAAGSAPAWAPVAVAFQTYKWYHP